jgi:UDPglucose 6-dehydrogenase
VEAHDPVALAVARRVFGDRIGYHDVSYDALRDADAALIVTEWPEFKQPDFARMKTLMRHPVIFDGRNLYELGAMRSLGFTYHAVGRPAVPGG